MKIFRCGNCAHSLFFENLKCENCGHLCGYSEGDLEMLTFAPAERPLISDRAGKQYRYCANEEHGVCNWLIPSESHETFCRACRYNRTIPTLSVEGNLEKWGKTEVAKHRVVYQLARLGLRPPSKLVEDEGLCFDFVQQLDDDGPMTGHAEGVVTILMSEADSAFRERMRQQFHEPYRTLVGHFRHEVGHYFWDRLVAADKEALAQARSIFGDDRADYAEALQAYYKSGAPADWQASYISAYATSHPWEDWAETWAHYLHIMDMVETAYCFHLAVSPAGTRSPMEATVSVDPYDVAEICDIVDVCVPVSYAVNSINRAMGLPDVYPFVISEPVRSKLSFIHGLMLPLREGANPKLAAGVA